MKVIAYTDGAAANNQDAESRCGGWGVVMMVVDDNGQQLDKDGSYKELSGTLKGATNNMMELEAVRRALGMLKRDGVDITIYADSEYAIGVLSKGWKAKANQNLVLEIKALLSKHTVRFDWVRGHAGAEHNERADKLAEAAAQRCSDDMDDSADLLKLSGKPQRNLL